ncbi:HDOD domain-containing protein [Massilia sp. IC2-476]|uniref:HDOD domain-containing protein n=1 Tax=Massilia sp. IC2-476 TaxID=2887199 RepID=UPI001D103849|nr:HDOD domain-containing protein [Massilia sp. IC2-476]MCC2974566.1 HDOD domain-containing protein [Massilia sp. IC2-476]
MKNWLARLFGGPARLERAAASAQHVSAPSGVVDSPRLFELDLAFYRWLAGGTVHAGEAPEGAILDELARLARDPQAAAGLVPRVPAVIPQLLRSLRDEGMSASELARQVGQDVSLVAEVIREVNSPYYRAGTKIGNIEGALMLLGQNGLRMLLARVAFRPVIGAQSGRLARQAAPLVWSQSEKCALAASMAAPSLGADPFEAYLAGLTRNVGLIVAFRLADQVLGPAALPQSDVFAHALLDSARTLSARIATLWELPPPVGQAILQAGQHDATPLAQALHEGDRLAMLRVLFDAGVEGAEGAAAALPGAQQRIFDKLQSAEE